MVLGYGVLLVAMWEAGFPPPAPNRTMATLVDLPPTALVVPAEPPARPRAWQSGLTNLARVPAHLLPSPQVDALPFEELAPLPMAEAAADPLFATAVRRVEAGRIHEGQVVAVDFDVTTGERLYLVQYADGDLEHFDARELKLLVFPSTGDHREA